MHKMTQKQSNKHDTEIYFNPLLHRYSFLRLLQQTTFKNIVTNGEIALKSAGAIPSFATMFSKLSNLQNVHFFQQGEHSRFSKCRLLPDCCMGERVNIQT